MRKGGIVTELTEKERVGETEREGQVGERAKADVRDTEDTSVDQTLEADLDQNHLMYEMC